MHYIRSRIISTAHCYIFHFRFSWRAPDWATNIPAISMPIAYKLILWNRWCPSPQLPYKRDIPLVPYTRHISLRRFCYHLLSGITNRSTRNHLRTVISHSHPFIHLFVCCCCYCSISFTLTHCMHEICMDQSNWRSNSNKDNNETYKWVYNTSYNFHLKLKHTNRNGYGRSIALWQTRHHTEKKKPMEKLANERRETERKRVKKKEIQRKIENERNWKKISAYNAANVEKFQFTKSEWTRERKKKKETPSTAVAAASSENVCDAFQEGTSITFDEVSTQYMENAIY